MDKDITFSAVTSMDDILGASVAQPRFSSQLLGAFAGLALLLSAIGLYGLMAYSVTQRRNEIGIQMALGATREDVLRLILRHGSRLAAIGLIASLAATRVLSLFEVKSRDPETFAMVAFLLAAVSLGASYTPAHRAAKVDPMVALHYE